MFAELLTKEERRVGGGEGWQAVLSAPSSGICLLSLTMGWICTAREDFIIITQDFRASVYVASCCCYVILMICSL